MNLVNLTPHTLNLYNEAEQLVITLPPSGTVARVDVVRTRIGHAQAVPCFIADYGEVTGLPDPDGDTIFVVSLVVRQARPDRTDIASPGELLRDAQGRPIGAIGLDVN